MTEYGQRTNNVERRLQDLLAYPREDLDTELKGRSIERFEFGAIASDRLKNILSCCMCIFRGEHIFIWRFVMNEVSSM